MRATRTLLSVVVLIGLCQGVSTAADWPHWRGPTYDGISKETGWSATWPQDGPKVLWRAAIGTGFATVSVADGRAYAMGNIGNKDTLYCFDAANGKELWQYSYAAPIDAKNHEGGPCATPTVSDGKVYTFSKRAKIHCLDAKTGDVLWSKDLIAELGVNTPTWGHAGSALILGDAVILNAGSEGLALNKADGSVIWKSGRGPAGYATAVPYTMNGQKGIAMFGAQEIMGIDPSTGKVLWRFRWKTSYDVNAADPIISGDTVFISSGYNKGCTLLRVTGGNVSQVWQNRDMRNHFNSCVLWKGHLYGFDEKTLRCLDLATGQERWAKEDLGKGSLMLADGTLIILSERGKLVTAKASPDGFNELASAQILRGKCWTMPVLANGKVYARNAVGSLVCVDVSK